MVVVVGCSPSVIFFMLVVKADEVEVIGPVKLAEVEADGELEVVDCPPVEIVILVVIVVGDFVLENRVLTDVAVEVSAVELPGVLLVEVNTDGLDAVLNASVV